MTRTADERKGVEFEALEYRADDTFERARLAFRPRPGGGWQVERDGRAHLDLGPGYALVRTRSCGVCSTDLDRRFLPFALPQVIGHEAVVEDADGQRCVVEINASCRALGRTPCAFCRAGLDTHCPERIVLGIHDLPGGFGPWLLAPRHALVPVPDPIPDATAALVEPFAAALHAVTTIDPKPGTTVAVLGPRRLGLLVVAALAAHRRASGRAFEILALARRPEIGALAVSLGADRHAVPPDGAAAATPLADVVIDTTGRPDGLALACALARSEVHLKSTHGQPALDCAHMTEAVVDEIAFTGCARGDDRALRAAVAAAEPLCTRGRRRVGWLCAAPPPETLRNLDIDWVRAPDARSLLNRLELRAAGAVETDTHASLPRVDVLVVDRADAIDAALRPDAEREVSPLRPRGELIVQHQATSSPSEAHDAGHALAHVLARGLRITTSRCGGFHAALALMADDARLCELGDRFVTDRFGPDALGEAFGRARSAQAIKVLIEHPS